MDKYLALGDSYTIGESVPVVDRWPIRLIAKLNEHGWKIESTTIIATTGWRTDNLRNAVEIADLNSGYALVSLLIGVNNQYQGKSIEQYEVEFKELLEMATRLAKSSDSIFVVSIPDYSFTPFGVSRQKEISKAIDAFNEVNKRLTTSRGIKYFDITDISRLGLSQPELVAPDNLHPSGQMYQLWVDRIGQGLLTKKKGLQQRENDFL